MARFFCESLEEQSTVVSRPSSSLDVPVPFPQAEPNSSKPSKNDKCDKHATTKQTQFVIPGYLLVESKDRKDCNQRKKKPSFSLWGALRIPATSSPSNRAWMGTYPKPKCTNTLETQLPVLETVWKHYTVAVNFKTYRLLSHSPRYCDTVPSYNKKLVKKIRSQNNAHFFDLNDPSFIKVFLASF